MDGINLGYRDNTHRQSALSWAAGKGLDIVVKLLINDASIDPRVFSD
jgi:hypothetical protein